MNAELIFIPSPARGHLVPALEMAKHLVQKDERLSITVLVIKPASDKTSTADSSYSGIRIVDIPPVDFQALPSDSSVSYISRFIRSHKDNVRNEVAGLVRNLGSTRRLAGFVVDMFCTPMIDVADEFGVATYMFFGPSASTLGLMFHLQGLRDYQDQDPTVYEDSADEVLIPSYRLPVPGKLIPNAVFHKDLLDHAKRFRETKGIIVNTFPELESHAINFLSAVQNIPPVYPIGPVLHFGSGTDPRHDEIVRWLDQQPVSSVVFLCFGSFGWFDEVQVREIAQALEKCGHRFLWSLRKPPSSTKFGPPSEYGDLGEVLPEGFIERMAGVGKVVGWAPQVAVLSHPAVGGFVTHCGWNSMLESLWFGVPMAAWPLYADQKGNAFQVVKDLGAAVEIKMEYKMGGDVVVTADEIGNGIGRLMDPDSDVRVRVEALKVKSRMAIVEPSGEFTSRFIENVMLNIG